VTEVVWVARDSFCAVLISFDVVNCLLGEDWGFGLVVDLPKSKAHRMYPVLLVAALTCLVG